MANPSTLRAASAHRTPQMRRVEERFGEDLFRLLERLRFVEEKTAKDISAELGVSKATVDRWLETGGLTYRAMAKRSA